MKKIGSLRTALTVAAAVLAGCGSSSSGGGTGGTSGGGTGGTTSTGGTTATGGTAATGGATATGGTTATGGVSGTGGAGGAAAGGAGGNAGAPGALPALAVSGNKLQDPHGKTIILRGSSLIDIGALYAHGGNSAAGITARIDKVIAAGVQGHVVRMPVYPKIDYNGGYPYCSPLPYPVGTGPSTTCTPATPMSASDYVSKVLKPAVDYATSKGLYVIIDHHQIDDATKGTSAADATTFWTDVAPQFASYTNVLYEPFNEPIDSSASWATLKPVVQGWITTIRAAAPNNIIIVPSTSYDQHPGDAASSPPTGTNLMFTAHIYPANWNSAFMSQLATATSKAPVFISEWGYTVASGTAVDDTTSTTWGTDFQAVVDGDGASWTAWVTDNGWTPSMFKDTALTSLTDFGTLVNGWLAAKAGSDWVQ
jgi:endoglucanase